jgi:hypothetical protein
VPTNDKLRVWVSVLCVVPINGTLRMWVSVCVGLRVVCCGVCFGVCSGKKKVTNDAKRREKKALDVTFVM